MTTERAPRRTARTLRVNLMQSEQFRRLLFFVYIYEGSVDFRRLGAAVNVTVPGGPSSRILLNDSPPGVLGCTIAMVTPEAGGLAVRPEVRWYTPNARHHVHELIDRDYGFGIPWTWAMKPPLDRRPRGH
ncbi:hypothetical protein [Streptomyces sp. NPDC059874]|uniref:hypothetical protein n=1 Tax=Streptomyces sp. NPDC059874 TaxID=3346983 RepID=UPI00364D4B38